MIQESASTTSSAQAVDRAALCSARWSNGLPPVAKGRAQSFIVTIESSSGRRHVTCCNYLNEYWMEWADDADPDESEIDDEGGKKWTGWMYDREQWGGDLSTCEIEGSVIGWLELPCAKGADDSVSWPNTQIAGAERSVQR